MSRKQKSQWKPETRLDATGIPFVDVLLTERFLLPPDALRRIGEKVPETLSEVVDLSGITFDDVTDVIDECLELGEDIYIAFDLAHAVNHETTILLDMRPNVSYETDPLHSSAKIFHLQNPQSFLPFLRSIEQVIVLSETDAHAWSAAMSLRKMGIKAWVPRQIPAGQ